MKSTYRGHRFPPEVISYAVWMYHRFTLSFRDVEDLLAERGITVSDEAIRNWCKGLDRPMPDLYVANKDGMGTSATSMSCL